MEPEVREAARNGNSAAGMPMLNILLGLWFFVSPWVFGAAGNPNAWNAWVVGAAIVIFAAIRSANPGSLKLLSWLNVALGIWVFASPWIFGYTDTGRLVNSLCIGIAVFLVSISSWSTEPRTAIPHHR